MGNIKISNITQTGQELFDDAETFLEDLDDREINSVKGGLTYISADISPFKNLTDPSTNPNLSVTNRYTQPLY